MLVTVAICTRNRAASLARTLESLAAMAPPGCEWPGCEWEVLVVDNNSEDGSADMAASEFPWVRLFRMERNLGFTGGHNFLLQQREAPALPAPERVAPPEHEAEPVAVA